MVKDLREKVQWCPLVSACPRWDSGSEKCMCPLVREMLKTAQGKEVWRRMVDGQDLD